MLNKEICKKCQKQFYRQLHSICLDNVNLWDKKQEELWNQGIVWCSLEGQKTSNTKWMMFKTNTDKVPDTCPYALEHIVSQKC